MACLLIAAALFIHNKHVKNEARRHLISMTQLIVDGCREGRLIVGSHECNDAADRMPRGGRAKPLDLN